MNYRDPRKHRSLYEEHPGLYAQTLAWLGGQYRVLGELTKARELVAEALCRDRQVSWHGGSREEFDIEGCGPGEPDEGGSS
jgi:hypothetical protein